MDPGFRAAFWMLFLISYLQANPVPSLCMVDTDNFCFNDIRQKVKCGTANFTYPTNVEKTCHHAVVQSFMKELEGVKHNCNDTDDINYTLEALEALKRQVLPLVQNTECQLQNKTSQFEAFVDAIEGFVQSFNNVAQKCAN